MEYSTGTPSGANNAGPPKAGMIPDWQLTSPLPAGSIPTSLFADPNGRKLGPAVFAFTKKTDYALLALSYLAGTADDRLVGPREIASHYDIPGELLAKVMQTLARAALVASVPGPAGGYRLSRPAPQISIGEVLEAVDGPLAIAQCWDEGPGGGCAQAQRCHLRGPLARMQEQIASLLRSTSLADVVDSSSATVRYGDAQPLAMAEPGPAAGNH